MDKYEHALRIAQILRREEMLQGMMVMKESEDKKVIRPIVEHEENETTDSLS